MTLPEERLGGQLLDIGLRDEFRIRTKSKGTKRGNKPGTASDEDAPAQGRKLATKRKGSCGIGGGVCRPCI